MPYQYLDDIALADVAFKAEGKTPEEMFLAAADATLNVMIEDLDDILGKQKRRIHVEDESLEMLLVSTLQELIYYKDAQGLLLRLTKANILKQNGIYTFSGEARGEKIIRGQHKLNTDVKAVTLHRLRVTETANGWEAVVVLDV